MYALSEDRVVPYCARSLIRNYRLGLRGDSQGIPPPPPQNKSAQQREQDFPLGFVFATLVIEYFPQIWQGGMLVCGGEVTATMGGMPNIPPVKQLFSF